MLFFHNFRNRRKNEIRKNEIISKFQINCDSLMDNLVVARRRELEVVEKFRWTKMRSCTDGRCLWIALEGSVKALWESF